MHQSLITLALLTILAPIASLAAADRPAGSRTPAPSAQRVRPYDTRSGTILQDGLRRSDTVRALVKALEQHDVVVYLQMQPQLKGRLAGTMTWLAATKYLRYVRVSINPELSGDAAVAALGHELRHALEVATEPSIVDDRSLGVYYQRNGESVGFHRNGWDTEAARIAGNEVRRDLANGRGTRVSESIH